GGCRHFLVRQFRRKGHPSTGGGPLPLGGFTGGGEFPAGVRLAVGGLSDCLAVAFQSRVNDDIDSDIYLVRRDANLNQLGAPFIGIDTTAANTTRPSITSFSNGSVVITYTLHNSANDSDIVARRVDAAGNGRAPFNIFTDADNTLADFSELTTLANQNFVAVFQVTGADANNHVFYTIRNNAGDQIVAPTAVAATTNQEISPHVAALADGGFV